MCVFSCVCLFVVWSTPVYIALCLAISTSRLFSPLSPGVRSIVLALHAPHLEGTRTKRLSFFNARQDTYKHRVARASSQPPFNAIFTSFSFLFIQSTETC